MNEKPKEENIKLDQAAKDLFDYAIDREDIEWLMAHLSPDATIDRAKVVYELPLLKMIGVGWAVSYYLAEAFWKTELLERYWQMVREFSGELSSSTEMLIGKDIDYFQVIKDRLDMYLAALNREAKQTEPATVIGREFARNCGNVDDLVAFMTGSKLFVSVIGNVKTYLENLKDLIQKNI